MKNIQLLVLFFFLAGCHFLNAQTKSYQIEGTITGSSKLSKLYFSEGNFQQPKPGAVKEIAVKAGKYTIKGSLVEPIPLWISLSPDLQQNAIQLIADEGKISLESTADLKSVKISGSKTQLEMEAFREQQANFKKPLDLITQEAQKEYQRGISSDSLSKRFAGAYQQAIQDLNFFHQSYIQQNPESFSALLAIPELIGVSQNFILADSLMHTLSAAVQATPTAKSYQNYISKQVKTAIGAFAPNFSSNTPEGQTLSLSSLKGKYVLIDFWAAWCGPCRKENPNLVKAYEQFKDKNFTILGVSLDRSRDNWLKAIKDDGLSWPQVSDLKYWSSEAGQLYGINSIPANFLLDPNGKIIARDLRGENLVNKLSEVLR